MDVKGIYFGLASSFFFSLMAFMVNHTLKDLPVHELSFIRGLTMVVLLLPFALPKINALFTSQAKAILTRSFAGSVSIVCYYWNLHQTSVANAVLLQRVSPIFTALLSQSIIGESITRRELISVLIVVVSGIVVQLPSATAETPFVIVIGFTGAMAGTAAYMSLRKASSQSSSALIIFTLSLFTMLLSSIIPGEKWRVPTPAQIPWTIAVGVTALIAQYFLTNCFRYLKASIGHALSGTVVVWSLLLDATFMSRYPSFFELVCYTLGLGAAAWGLIPVRKKQIPLES